MEKNKNVLIASISGIVACLVCVGILFLFSPKENNDLKGNEELPKQEVEMQNDDEELLLGDLSGCAATTQYCPSGYSSYNEYICASTSVTSQPPCGSGTIAMQDGCHTTRNKITGCYGCKDGYNPAGYDCILDTTLKAPCCNTSNNTTLTTDANCSTCSTCVSGTCPKPNLSCRSPKYNGSPQELATCSGTLSQNIRTEVGSQRVTCTNGSESTEKECSILKGDGRITNFSNITVKVGENKSLSAQSNSGGNITYELLSGNAVSLNGAVVTGQNPGTSTIRANLASTSNYNSATANITVTVTAPSSTPTCEETCEEEWGSNTDANYTSCVADCKNGGLSCTIAHCYRYECRTSSCCKCSVCDDNYTLNSNKQCELRNTSPSPSSTPASFTEDGDCTDGKEMSAFHYCNIPSGKSCKASFSTTFLTTGVIKCAVDCTIDCGGVKVSRVDVSPQSDIYVAADYEVTLTFTAYSESGAKVAVTWPEPNNSLIRKNCSTSLSSCSYTFDSNTCGSYPFEGTVIDKNGNTAKMPKITIKKFNPWGSGSQLTSSTEPTLKTRESRKWVDDCEANENIVYDEVKKIYTYTHYNRCCGGGSSSTPQPTATPVGTPVPTPKPTPTPPPKIKKCYIDSENNYHWTSSPEASWKIATDKDGNEITNPDLCPPKPGCYIDPDGEYQWGEFSAHPGYTFVAEITDDDLCKKDEKYACYKMDSSYNCYKKDSTYVLAKTAPDGYTKVDDKTLCGKEYIWSKTDKDGYVKTDLPYNQCENPACYFYEKGNKRVWGYYSKVNGYYLLVDENDKPLSREQCVNNMCYKDPDGDYVWGNYETEPGYEPLPDITDISECGPDVPTPPTGLTPSKVMYIFMAILMAFGIGFIYYSTIMKKEH